MKITIDGFFDEYCQGCPGLDVEKSFLFTYDKQNYKCKNSDICPYLLKRLKEKVGEENEKIDTDVISIVRCGQCKYKRQLARCYDRKGNQLYVCDHEDGLCDCIKDDYFCCFGERIEDENNFQKDKN